MKEMLSVIERENNGCKAGMINALKSPSMCSVHLRRSLTTFNLNKCRKEQGNYTLGGNFLNPMAPLTEDLVSKKEARLWEGNS